MRYTVRINLGGNHIDVDIDKNAGRTIIDLSESLNRLANELSNFLQEHSSKLDSEKCRMFFGEIMGTIISEIIIPIENMVHNDSD